MTTGSRLAFYFSGLITVGFVGILSLHLQQVEQRSLLHILASREPELGLPVFAQFVVTQRLTLPEIALVTGLTVPLYLRDTTQPLVIDLYHDQKLVYRWRVRPDNYDRHTIIDVALPLPSPRLLEGNLEVRFAAPTIDHDHQDNAPLLFTETADSAYPEGNYRIAENEKSGDVGMEIFYQRQRLDSYLMQFSKKPLLVMANMTRWALLALLLITFPHSVARMWEYTSRRTTSRTE